MPINGVPGGKAGSGSDARGPSGLNRSRSTPVEIVEISAGSKSKVVVSVSVILGLVVMMWWLHSLYIRRLRDRFGMGTSKCRLRMMSGTRAMRAAMVSSQPSRELCGFTI